MALVRLMNVSQFARHAPTGSRAHVSSDENSRITAIPEERGLHSSGLEGLAHPRKGKETMRHILNALTGLVLLSAVVGCHHTCGVCDCTNHTPCAGGCCIGIDTPAPAGTAIPAEPLKVMPKGGGKE